MNILIKNWLDVCIGALVYWATGFALMYGGKGNSFVSYAYFFGYGMPGEESDAYGKPGQETFLPNPK